jgi:branched-chain amino acid transport system ATP-binding protein
MLEIRNISVHYGAIRALDGVSLIALKGSTTAILGANGAGKSSLLRAISGISPTQGSILLDGKNIVNVPAHQRAKLGIAHALEGRRLFRDLSVETNLRLAWSFGRRMTPCATALDAAYGLFPILREKRSTAAGWLSGGQQQMVVLSAAMIQDPLYLLLDEPSLGLAPIIVTQIYETLSRYSESSKATILVAEQIASIALKASDHCIVLKRGRTAIEGKSNDFLTDHDGAGMISSYL